MARVGSGKGRGRKTAAKKKRKVAVSRKTQPPPRGPSDNTPSRVANIPHPDTSTLDVANELVTRRYRHQTAATSAAGISDQQPTAATLAVETSLSGDADVVPAVTVAHQQMLTRLTELEATVAQLLPLLPSTPGIGHNNPPPLELAELDEIKRDIALLKAREGRNMGRSTSVVSVEHSP